MRVASVRQAISPNRQVSCAWLFGTILVSVAGAIAAYPLKVTVDGYTYISSARSIFTTLAPQNYFWVREPGYPLFLRLLFAAFGASDVILTIFQAAILSASVCVVALIIFGHERNKRIPAYLPIVLLVPVLVPQYFGYSSMVLKQVLICALLTVLGVVLWISYRVTRPRRVVVYLIILIVGSAVAPMVSFQLKYSWGLGVLVASCVLSIRKLRLVRASLSLRNRRRALSLAALFPICMLGVALTVSNVTLNKWDDYKATRSSASTLPVDAGLDEGDVILDTLTEPLSAISSVFERIPKLLMITKSNFNAGGFENDFYTAIQADPAWRCGAYDEWVYEPYSSYGRFIQASCRSSLFHSRVASVHTFGHNVYVLSSWSLLVAPLFALIRRRYSLLVVLVAPYSFMLLYGLSGSYTIDRYGQPLFPFSFCCLVYLIAGSTKMSYRFLNRAIFSVLRK